jgi:hypothetical protein
MALLTSDSNAAALLAKLNGFFILRGWREVGTHLGWFVGSGELMVVVLRRCFLLHQRRRDLLSLDNGLVRLKGWSSGAMMSEGKKTSFYFMFCNIQSKNLSIYWGNLVMTCGRGLYLFATVVFDLQPKYRYDSKLDSSSSTTWGIFSFFDSPVRFCA